MSGFSIAIQLVHAGELAPGAVVLDSQDLYGASLELLYTVFGSFGVKTVIADFSAVDNLREKTMDIEAERFDRRADFKSAFESFGHRSPRALRTTRARN